MTEMEEENQNDDEMDNNSDVNLDSDMSSEDDIVEELEEKGVKRKLSDDDDNSEEGEEATENKSRKKFREEKYQKKLQKPPTASELLRLRETENLFHSNLFRLQTEEMLKEVEIKLKHKSEFEAWFVKFSDWVLKVEDNETKYELNDQVWLKKYKIKMPISQTPYIVKGTYQFKKPSKVSIIGSYATNLILGSKIVVDVLIEIPESFFQKEDYLNCRYHRKRALYMCEFLNHVQLLPNLVEDVNFVSEEVDHLKPKIELIPFGKISKHVTVTLHFALHGNTYKMNRFSPNKNNVRRRWYFKENISENENVPTPFYNSSIIADLTIERNMSFLKESISKFNNIKDGIKLLKIWLRQRELDDSISGFNGYCTAMLVCYLLKTKKLNQWLSSYQIFRNVCHYLSGCDWTTNGITLCSESEDENLPALSEFQQHHKVVFIDVTGYHNICYAMSTSTFKKVQYEAEMALKWLNDPNVNSFQALFIMKVPFYQHYDHMVMFNNSELLENVADAYCSKDLLLSHCSVISPLVRDSIISLLIKGLGNRVTQLHVKLPTKNRWKVEKKLKKCLTLTVGFNLDPNNYFSVIDKAQESETEEFRKFWGDKSELRRFLDGSITEAVVWKGRTLSEKRLICREILTYLLNFKFGFERNDFRYVANQLEFCFSKNVEENSLKVAEAFDQLMKQLRDLKDLPLDIVTVQGVSPVFRYTDAYPPQALKQSEKFKKNTGLPYSLIKLDLNTCPPWISPVDVVIQMAGSSKWPRDLEAIRRIKAAFNIKISDNLSSQHGVICKTFQDKIELIKNGFVFRIRIVYPNEIALLKESIDPKGLVKYVDTEKSLKFEKESIHLPKLSSALHGLYQEYNSFGPACCLVKRWISSHLIDDVHMSEESIELLVASLYLKPQPHEPPQQPQVAFLRFLQMMTTTNWNADPIILNINDELPRSEIIEIESYFNKNRSNLPPVFIATPYDQKKSIWTKNSPDAIVLLRLIHLCATALSIIEAQIYTKNFIEVQALFEPCLDVFDVVIRLKDEFNPKKEAVTLINFTTFQNDIQKIPINGFDPVQLYLQELRDCYEDLALFFHDSYGGSAIGVVWKPNVKDPCDFKIVHLPARKYNSDTQKVEFNQNAILEDFEVIGKGLVEKIEVKVGNVWENFNN